METEIRPTTTISEFVERKTDVTAQQRTLLSQIMYIGQTNKAYATSEQSPTTTLARVVSQTGNSVTRPPATLALE